MASAEAPAPGHGALAMRLGYAGLLPFVAGGLGVWVLQPQPQIQATVLLALSAYAATIVSFLGGIHWGLAMRRAVPPATALVWGVMPSLLAWAALLMPPQPGLVVHALMLLACYAVDRKLYPAEGVQAWLPLRLRLSAVAAVSCLVGAAGA